MSNISSNPSSAFTSLPPDGDDLGYFKIVTFSIALALLFYWGFHYIRQSAMEHLGTIVLTLFLSLSATVIFFRERRRHLLADRNDNPVLQKYNKLLSEVSAFSAGKRKLLEDSLMPQIRELMEDKLPALLARRDKYRAYHEKCETERVSSEISELEDKIRQEEDEDIRQALERNLATARSTQSNYRKIEKTLKLYELQIASIEKHLENFDSKLYLLDLEDDIKAAAEAIIIGINRDIGYLEKALTQIDDFSASDSKELPGGRTDD